MKKKNKINVFDPEITQQDIASVTKVLKQKELTGIHSNTNLKFEREFAKYCDSKYGISLTNCTSALYLAIHILKLKPDSEILISSCTNIATALACYHNDCIPIPVDSDFDTWNLDEKKITKLITKKTKAIIAVHFLGNPAQMKKLKKICNKYNLYLIEDAAEAHGSQINKKKVGSFSDIACFSFYSNKTITSGEGGMIVTKNKKFYDMLKLYINVGFSRKRFVHYIPGFNLRYTAIQGALAYSQFKRINIIINKKIKIFNTYKKYLSNNKFIKFQKTEKGNKNTYWMIGILNISKKINKTYLMKKLKSKGIETRSFFLPINRQPCFKEIFKKKKISNPVSDFLWDNGLYLPSGHNLKKKDIKYVCDEINKIYHTK
jgi:perosamine synthetase